MHDTFKCPIHQCDGTIHYQYCLRTDAYHHPFDQNITHETYKCDKCKNEFIRSWKWDAKENLADSNILKWK